MYIYLYLCRYRYGYRYNFFELWFLFILIPNNTTFLLNVSLNPTTTSSTVTYFRNSPPTILEGGYLQFFTAPFKLICIRNIPNCLSSLMMRVQVNKLLQCDDATLEKHLIKCLLWSAVFFYPPMNPGKAQTPGVKSPDIEHGSPFNGWFFNFTCYVWGFATVHLKCHSVSSKVQRHEAGKMSPECAPNMAGTPAPELFGPQTPGNCNIGNCEKCPTTSVTMTTMFPALMLA